MPARVTAVALGSNLGDRAAHLRYGVEQLTTLLGVLRVSSFIDTAPEGGAGGPRFLNGIVLGTSRAAPDAFLARLQAIETARHRTRPYAGAPRTLDLDLIIMGDLVVDRPGLTVPHPRFRGRSFVLEPLAALDPELVDPVTGLTMSALLARLREAAADD
jgi:2-amino-4-hydroxy-6-hydroxymethyldihydropteridine diphosphokinase